MNDPTPKRVLKTQFHDGYTMATLSLGRPTEVEAAIAGYDCYANKTPYRQGLVAFIRSKGFEEPD